MTNYSSKDKGFTLLEVMVALTIFALVAVTITDTISVRVNGLISMRTQLLASFVVENQLNEIRIKGVLPDIGETKDKVEMADQEWHVITKVEETQFPGMRMVSVSVAKEETKDSVVYSLSSIMGEN